MRHAGLFTIAATMMLGGTALAEGTVKAKNDCFEELAERARRPVELGGRRGFNAPTFAEHEMKVEIQPLSSSDVQRVVSEHLAELEYCYDKAASRSKAPSGELSLALSVEPTGRVTSVTITAPGVNSRSLEKCIKAQVKRWRFPASNTESQIDYPLLFDVAGPAQ